MVSFYNCTDNFSPTWLQTRWTDFLLTCLIVFNHTLLDKQSNAKGRLLVKMRTNDVTTKQTIVCFTRLQPDQYLCCLLQKNIFFFLFLEFLKEQLKLLGTYASRGHHLIIIC